MIWALFDDCLADPWCILTGAIDAVAGVDESEC